MITGVPVRAVRKPTVFTAAASQPLISRQAIYLHTEIVNSKTALRRCRHRRSTVCARCHIRPSHAWRFARKVIITTRQQIIRPTTARNRRTRVYRVGHTRTRGRSVVWRHVRACIVDRRTARGEHRTNHLGGTRARRYFTASYVVRFFFFLMYVIGGKTTARRRRAYFRRTIIFFFFFLQHCYVHAAGRNRHLSFLFLYRSRAAG